MPDGVAQYAVSIAIAFVAALPGIMAFYSTRAKTQNDRDAAINDRIMKMTDAMSKRIDDLEETTDRHRLRIRALEDENATLRYGLRMLINQLREHGHDPVWDFPLSSED